MSDLSAAIVRLEESILRARSREGGSSVKRIMLDVSDVELLIQEASYADALQAEVERTRSKDSEMPTTVEQIIDRMGSLSSAAIARIIVAGQKHQDERFADGVFE